MKIQRVFVFGYGYSARYLAQRLAPLGVEVLGSSRQERKASHIIYQHSPQLMDEVQRAQAILISAPPSKTGHDDIFEQFAPLIVKAKPQWLGYLSTTGVYGDHQGQWVDETSAINHPGSLGQNRLHAEQQWLSLYQKHQIPTHIFRVSGIYGPGRNAMTRIQQGKKYTIVKENQFFSRIHVEDIAKALAASMAQPTPGEVFNLADDHPCAPQKVDDYACKLLQREPLPRLNFEDAELSAMARQFYNHSKKVSAEKIKSTLKLDWDYPNYEVGLREGCDLASLLASE